MAKFTFEAIEKIPFDCMCSFATENYIGIWEHRTGQFVMFAKNEVEFHMFVLPNCGDYEDFDWRVFKKVNEHITDVWEESTYNIQLCNY